MNDEAAGCGCVLFFLFPLLAFAAAYMAHCGWSSYHP